MYYIAIVTPVTINEQVLKWKLFMKDRFNCNVALKSPAHITLVPPFWMDTQMQTKLEQSLVSFGKNEKRFPIHLNGFGCFKPRVIFVQVEKSEPLKLLKANLERYVLSAAYPVKQSAREYHPHLTIANRDLLKHDFVQAWDYFSSKKYEASFEATAVSLLKHDGARWITAYHAGLTNN